MHKAIAVIQFKLEAGIIKRHPEFDMDNRLLLDKIDYKRGVLRYGDKEYKMLDSSFPTIDPASLQPPPPGFKPFSSPSLPRS